MASQGVLAGQAALVTGGGGGIGGASAAWLARDGAAVMIMGRTEKTLVATKARIQEFAGPGAKVEYFVGDALDAGDLGNALTAAAALSDRLAIAVSVVGGGNMKPLLMFDETEALEEMRKNIVSAFMVIRQATPLMAAAGWIDRVHLVGRGQDPLAVPHPVQHDKVRRRGPGPGRGSGVEPLCASGSTPCAQVWSRPTPPETGCSRTRRSCSSSSSRSRLVARACPTTSPPACATWPARKSSWVTGQSIGIEGGAEMGKAPYLESLVRSRFGDEAIDAALGRHHPDLKDGAGVYSTRTSGRAAPGLRTRRSRRLGNWRRR